MKKILLLLSIFLTGLHSKTNAQLFDVIQGSVGIAVFPADEQTDFLTGKPDNLYGGFTPGQVIGVGASKFITDKFQLLGTFEVMQTQKSHYQIFLQKFGANLKYNIIAPDVYRLSPYLIGGGTFSMISLSQNGFQRAYDPPAEYSGINKINVTDITYQENDYVFYSPVFGTNIGAGVDINIFEIFSIYGEVSYNYGFAKNSGLQNSYTSYNHSNLTYTNFTAGVRIYMY